VQLAREAEHELESGRGLAYLLQVEPLPAILDAERQPSVLIGQADPDALPRMILDAVLHGVCQKLVQDQGERQFSSHDTRRQQA